MAALTTEDIGEKVSDKLFCESCGEEFFCGANVGQCWCFTIELKPETARKLRDNYKDCLCGVCLSKFSEKTQSN